MLKRDEDGYLIEDFPEGTEHVDGRELLVKISEGALPEYSKEAFNAVVSFFRKRRLSIYVDNINIYEWMSEIESFYKRPLIDCSKFAYSDENESIYQFVSIIMPSESPDKVMKDLMNETLLSVAIKSPTTGDSIMHFALPYCIIEEIVRIEGGTI